MFPLLYLAMSFLLAMAPPFISLRSLSDASSVTVGLNHESPKVFVVFKKDCKACHKQVTDLTCLPPSTEVVLVGMFSTEKNLRREYLRFRSPWPGLYGDVSARKKLSIHQTITPQIRILGKGANVHLKGYIPCKDIAQKLKTT